MDEGIFESQKILSFLKRLKSINATFEVIYKNTKTKASIRYVGEYSFEIYCKDAIEVTDPTIDLELYFENKVYHIKTEILNKRENILLLMIPTQINIWAKRKFPRKNVYGKLYLSISFIRPLEYSPRSSLDKIPENLRSIKEELDKDVPDLRKIVAMIIKEVEKIAENYDFIFYKRGMTLPSSATVSMYFKRPLLVEDTSNLESYIIKYEPFEIVTYGDYMRKASWDENKVIDQIKKLRTSFLSQGIRSLICVPINVLSDTIGFIFCRSNQKKFSIEDVLYVSALSSIISEAYIKNKINTVKNTNELLFPIIDISAGGVRFEVDGIIGKLLKVDDSIRLLINIESREIQTIGKILRIDTTKSGKKLWVATMFTFISPDDQQYILRFTS
ncbi:MAG: PilZ domain-containing protein [Brevinematia bacterium]